MQKPTRVQRKLKRRKRVLNFILLITITTIALMVMLKHSFFNVDNFQVKGNYKLTKENIINSSSINKGENIFKINTKLSTSNIKNLSYIKDIKIKRKLPKTIVFEVIERKGIIQVKNISTTLLVDIDGFVLEELEDKNENLPIIFGFEINNVKLGDNIFSKTESMKVIDFIIDLNNTNLLKKSTKIDMTIQEDINIELNNGISVAFGTLDNVKYKLRLLNEIIHDIEMKNISCKMIIMNKGDNPILVIDDQSGG